MNKGGKNNRIPFSQRLFWSVFSIFLGFSICFLLFQYQRENEFAQAKLNGILSNYNYQLCRNSERTHNLDSLAKYFVSTIPQKELRITVIDSLGNVVFDNNSTELLDNHNNRSEVRKAYTSNEGFAIRNSASTGKRYFYSASRINGYIYRTALPYDPYVQSLLRIDKSFIYFIVIMTLIFFFVFSRFTFSIGHTISKLRAFANNIDKGQLSSVDYLFPDDELGDISQNIITLYRQQREAKNELSLEREKLIKHFQYSNEGFAMFGAEGKEILSNIQFIQFLNIVSDKAVDQAEDALCLEELEPIRDFIAKGGTELNRKKKALRDSVIIDKNGKILIVECLLFQDNSYELSINDISRHEEESRIKRQLTQNVAHELKTPVSGIQGYLETIITNPTLSDEKKNFFIARCYAQSTRLVDLLNDISVLNRLDEASDMFDLKAVNITELLAEIEKESRKEMTAKAITSEIILPNNPVVYGNETLLYSIFQNLYDNAIVYAGEHTTITVNCYKEDAAFYYFSFSDNGIGIPEEHVNRIFERFYRIDKGRSRKMGGTGLGLSIVKNSINFHKGQISAKSGHGKGLTFFFTLKKRRTPQPLHSIDKS